MHSKIQKYAKKLNNYIKLQNIFSGYILIKNTIEIVSTHLLTN